MRITDVVGFLCDCGVISEDTTIAQLLALAAGWREDAKFCVQIRDYFSGQDDFDLNKTTAGMFREDVVIVDGHKKLIRWNGWAS